jgi:GTPase
MHHSPREDIKGVAERAVLVGVVLPGADVDERDPLGELRSLAETAGAAVVGEVIQRRGSPRAATFLGKGKVAEVGLAVKSLEANVVIVDNDLAPNQVRELEKAFAVKVVDRSELILDIFANRATTRQAQLQVEIAQLEYTAPRLRAMWSHLGQVTGGAPVGVGTRGPGEQQLEIDRRLVQRRLLQLKRELAGIQARKTREVADRRLDHFTAGLVGYTNAGKSTLFNALTRGGAFAHPKLFATLGTRVEQWNLGGGNTALLSDTVGFIRNLPHHLVASFRSTLEESILAHLLIVVVDTSDPNALRQLRAVEETLEAIEATTQPRLLVLNKIDQIDDPRVLERWLAEHPGAIPLSAKTGEGLDELRERTLTHMLGDIRDVEVRAALADGRTIDFLEKRTPVLDRHYENGAVVMRVRLGRRQVDQLLSHGARIEIDGRPIREALATIWDPPPPPRARRIPPHERLVGEAPPRPEHLA